MSLQQSSECDFRDHRCSPTVIKHIRSICCVRGGWNCEFIGILALERIVEISSVANNGDIPNCEVRTTHLRGVAVIAAEVGGVEDCGDGTELCRGDTGEKLLQIGGVLRAICDVRAGEQEAFVAAVASHDTHALYKFTLSQQDAGKLRDRIHVNNRTEWERPVRRSIAND